MSIMPWLRRVLGCPDPIVSVEAGREVLGLGSPRTVMVDESALEVCGRLKPAHQKWFRVGDGPPEDAGDKRLRSMG